MSVSKKRKSPRVRRLPSVVAAAAALTVGVSGLGATGAVAITTVSGIAQGQTWTVQDAAMPGLDTGSVRNTSGGALSGFGGIRLDVDGSTNRLNGILMRGFGINYDGDSSYSSANAVNLDGIDVTRDLTINKAGSYGRFFDTFTNTTRTPQTVSIAFGGSLGVTSATVQPTIAGTGNGDTAISNADGWASWSTPATSATAALPLGASTNGPSATVFGTPGYAASLDRMGDFQQGPFDVPLAAAGDDSNHPGFVNEVTIAPGETVSFAHFVVTGISERDLAAGSQVQAVQATAATLTTTPDFSGLSTPEICSVANFDLTSLTTAGFSAAACDALPPVVPPVTPGTGSTPAALPETSSPYNVIGKTITQQRADIAAGLTNSQQIVRAYLDRIAAYDQGPQGLHSVLAVAPDAMEQAAAADTARLAGDTRPLLGVPIMVKDIIDTKDMPTTGGSLLFDGYVPTKDSWQVAKLREAGAIILGKANLSKFANSGHYSESDYGQVWNAFDQSKSPIGSSGGSAVATASSFAAASMGSQTGDSLWGPSGAASLTSLRGTDGMQSSQGTMPLTIVQDYVGFISQSPADQALLLNATAREDNPNDTLDDVSNGRRPADWTTELTDSALQGARIGVPASAFDDPFQTTVTSDALRAQFARFEAAGATIIPITDAPAAPTRTRDGGDTSGWAEWVADHPDNPYETASQINSRSTTGLTPVQLAAFEFDRAAYREVLAGWMDQQGVDVLLYPAQLSDVHLNDSNANSFGRRDPQSSASGVPTVMFPAGTNANGSPIGFQLQGKAFQDAELLGMAYAFETSANLGRVLPTITPALVFDASALPGVVIPPTALPAPGAPIDPLPADTAGLEPAAVAPRPGTRFPIIAG
ncbi:amidase [Conyzicola sp.]|uniref:amidase n=1 Tax=Conyzicola sp. TaxID=1969404 RepID=UPI0039898B6C